MTYKIDKFPLFLRVLLIFLSLMGLAYAVVSFKLYLIVVFTLLSAYTFINFYNFAQKRLLEISDFFESVKYRDFSRWFSEDAVSSDVMSLHKGFNDVNKVFKEISSDKERQYIYLEKIIELIDAGIISYKSDTGEVLWINETFTKQFSIPSIKNINFIEKRMGDLYQQVFADEMHNQGLISIEKDGEKIKTLVSKSVFKIEDEKYHLVVLKNVEETLNQNEADSWKKLLSVMTHEIMNSIAPISSLANTLEGHIEESIKDPKGTPLDPIDLKSGIETIRKRSEGLMKFAKTYRSLNKITKLNLSKIKVNTLFESIRDLLKPSLDSKGINLLIDIPDPNLEVEIDQYLIEQVIINLLLNAIDACAKSQDPKILMEGGKRIDGQVVLKVSDNGYGIPDEIADKIFVPFFSTRKTGSGIGLSLCKQIMMLHKGKILVKSVEGKGSVFSLVF